MKQQNCETTKIDKPKAYVVSKVVDEGKGQKSIFFNESYPSKPGQFIFIWLPGVDEKPMAVSYSSENEFAFTYHTVGPFTEALNNVKAGDKLGIRGPYGTSFSLKKNACVVAGGIGISSVSTLIDQLKNPLVIYGARDKNHLIYQDRYKSHNVVHTTDDGSFGKKGYTTDALKEILDAGEHKIDIIYCCGPEIMMKKIFDIAQEHNIPCEMSIERYMKCGFGICGNCMVNEQIACKDGPIFNQDQLAQLPEFGEFARKKTGKKVTLKEYYERG